MKELIIEALADNLPTVLAFVDGELEQTGCSLRAQMQVDVAVEEIFINIASYAYNPATGPATIRVTVTDAPPTLTLTFLDHGVPYDPLAKADPDVTLSAMEREIGGLGIFLVKKSMDAISYEYKDGQNILTVQKNL